MSNSLGMIAVVDDDESVREALQRLLRSAGYKAATFATAEDFLSTGDRAGVDCLVVDVNLPGMSGVALVSALVAAGTPVPAVLITARDDAATRELIGRLRSVPKLSKPFRDDELFTAIEHVRRRAP